MPPDYGRRRGDKPPCGECGVYPCRLCNGSGLKAKINVGHRYDRGDGVIYGAGSYSTSRCPHGCPPPRVHA